MEEHDHKRCVYISQKKKSKPLAKSSRKKKIPQKFIHHTKTSLDESHGKCVKTKTNASLSKIKSIFR
jgi:hypothetical protein